MMVAVTLVLIMMMMFAEVFEIASGMHHRVRGLAKNDQRARILQTMITADLEKRTFRHLVPFVPNETGYGRDRQSDQRQGYFYISENNPTNDSDDVLQFTVRSTILHSNRDATPYYGLVTSNPIGTGTQNLNRQETPNSSTAAEVCYFLRNGILYRRVLLLYQSVGRRTQPFDDSNSIESFNVNHPSGAYTGRFWRDFDFSAHLGKNGTGVKLHTDNSLVNTTGGSNFSLGRPGFRFGHDRASHFPREFVPGPGPDGLWSTQQDNGPFFIGRFTHEETSHGHFGFPHTPSVDAGGNAINDGNPMKKVGVQNNPLAVGEDGVVNQYRGGSRRAEDILMTNVHSFDIKVWDTALGEFVDIGHSRGTGDFRYTRRLNTSYGPGSPTGKRVFDTWHPTMTTQPPYRTTFYTDYVAQGKRKGIWTRWEDANGNGALDSGEDFNNNGILDRPTYAVGNVVFPESEAYGPLVFRCVGITGAGAANTRPPRWPQNAGSTVVETEDRNNNGLLDSGEDINGNNLLDSLKWQAIDNWIPLKAIQITIRLRDPNSELMRQMTQVVSLTR